MFPFVRSFIVTAMMLTASIAQADEFVGSEGPVSVVLKLYQPPWASLEITYSGHLYFCTSWSEGRSPSDVNILYVTESPSGRESFLADMRGLCWSPYGGGDGVDEARALVSSGTALWQKIFHGQDLSGDQLVVELAFESLGHWDSQYGANYVVTLHRQP